MAEIDTITGWLTKPVWFFTKTAQNCSRLRVS